VSIVGYDDVPAAAWPSYDLTTVRQRTNQMITATVDILLSEIENQSAAPCQVRIDGPLVLRGSALTAKGK
jgi:DNA-binding LacI/PurR family transcriptional regulator